MEHSSFHFADLSVPDRQPSWSGASAPWGEEKRPLESGEAAHFLPLAVGAHHLGVPAHQAEDHFEGFGAEVDEGHLVQPGASGSTRHSEAEGTEEEGHPAELPHLLQAEE